MKIITTLAAVVALSGCSAVQQLATQDDGGRLDSDPPTTAAADTRIDGGWFLYPSDGSTSACNNLASPNHPNYREMPCDLILNVCVIHDDGYRSTKWMPTIFRCTDESPTWRDVCITQPEHIDFYGYTKEQCGV